MKKIIPFKKKLTFNTNVSEITSISLENTLHYLNNYVEGDIIISGNYKITDTSIKTDEFNFNIPIEIEIDKKYNTDNILIDIDDFYYEIINNNILEVNIDVLIDNITERPIIEQMKEENNLLNELEINSEKIENVNNAPIKYKEERCIELENVEIEETKQDNTLFNNLSNDNEVYSTYHIYIVREGDTIESIISNYKTTREKLDEYNDLNELKIGDKIIIPE